MVMKGKIIVFGLAGCLTLGFSDDALTQYNHLAVPTATEQQSLSLGVEQLPQVTITSEQIKAKSEVVNIEIEYPVISGLGDEAYQAHLNHQIRNQILKEMERIKREAAEYARLAKKENWEIRPFELNISYSVKHKQDILSFTITTYTYTGGAHGDQHTMYYNIDLHQHKAIPLADLFKEGSDYQELINAEIRRQIEEQMATGEGIYFGMGEDSPLGEIEGFTSISEDQNYYLEAGNLVIAFGRYEIAPGVAGEPTFKIPLGKLKDVLKEEYRSLFK